jgi:hypothetical protein
LARVSPSLSIAPGEARTLTVAGVPFTIAVEPETRKGVALPSSYQPFCGEGGPNGVSLRVGSRERLPIAKGSLLYDSGLHWRAVEGDGLVVFEMVHPPTSLSYCRATAKSDFSEAEILFSELAWREIASDGSSASWEIPYPLDQLLMVPALARQRVVLLHAGGAVLSERALVFAGHSGDGKTTLTGLLGREGVELLSDERIAIARTLDGFRAFGTPWPGEGNVVSSASAPLGGLFVLRKASRHRLGAALPRIVFPELLSRAIVPYYLEETGSRILELFDELQTAFPPKDLHFALEPGLSSLLVGALSEGILASA